MPTTLPESSEVLPTSKNVGQERKPLSKKMLLIIGGSLLLLIIVVSILFSLYTRDQSETTKKANDSLTPGQEAKLSEDFTQPAASKADAPAQTFIYGTWTGQTSAIKAVDLNTSKTLLLASLPIEIKKVSVLSPQTLLYIDQTDTRDHGKRISLYSISDKTITASIPAAEGFGIDDYTLSPDKKYLAIWEVSFAQGSQVLQGGRSRVYAVDLSRPTVKQLLYDEVSSETTPVNYPRAILNNGTVFTDKFLPNDPHGGAGWAYGMSVVDFDGTNKRAVETMKAGTYGTQPSLSPDGKYLLFSGYDGSKGEGSATKAGYRQAILTPNTVELLNTQTLQRFKLPNLSNANTYPSSEWDEQAGKPILTTLSTKNEQTGIYSYDLAAQQANKVAIPSQGTATYGYLAQLSNATMLIGSQEDNASSLGNLGENYAYPFNQLAFYEAQSSKVKFISLEDSFAQYITIRPANYFNNVLGIKTVAQADPQPTFVDFYSEKNQSKENLQLYTFFLKFDLAETRLIQQTAPPSQSEEAELRCRELAAEQCKAQGQVEGTDTYDDCVKTNKNENKKHKSDGLCYDSPLYLYGTPGKQVRVKIQTPIFNAIPDSSGEYAVTLGTNGNMHINNKTYKSIAYDYKSNLRRLTPPKTGTIAKNSDMEKVLKKYAQKLGLNHTETADLVQAGKQKVTSPYVFISFFDQQTSQEILPISFFPEPDNYRNIVFYFKGYEQKPTVIPQSPTFPEPIKRTGFTAVEISELVE